MFTARPEVIRNIIVRSIIQLCMRFCHVFFNEYENNAFHDNPNDTETGLNHVEDRNAMLGVGDSRNLLLHNFFDLF